MFFAKKLTPSLFHVTPKDAKPPYSVLDFGWNVKYWGQFLSRKHNYVFSETRKHINDRVRHTMTPMD